MVKRDISNAKSHFLRVDSILPFDPYGTYSDSEGNGKQPEDEGRNFNSSSVTVDRSRIREIERRIWRENLLNETGFKGKKLWHILKLAIIPITLAILTAFLQWRTNDRQHEQQKADKDLEEQIANDKAKQETLTKYLDQMSDLLQKGLRTEKQNSEARTVAQAKTVVALQSLDPKRQHLVIQFLDAENLNALTGEEGLLSDARMSKAKLSEGDLSGANLIKADLSQANLTKADLRKVNLSGTNLQYADLSNADLSYAVLSDANSSNPTKLSKVDLSYAKLTNVNLSYANLINADLSNANLSGAILINANLSEAKLDNAYLSNIIFINTKLQTTQNITSGQLKSSLLCNVTLPQNIHPDETLYSNRDCVTLSRVLYGYYPDRFKTIREA